MPAATVLQTDSIFWVYAYDAETRQLYAGRRALNGFDTTHFSWTAITQSQRRRDQLDARVQVQGADTTLLLAYADQSQHEIGLVAEQAGQWLARPIAVDQSLADLQLAVQPADTTLTGIQANSLQVVAVRNTGSGWRRDTLSALIAVAQWRMAASPTGDTLWGVAQVSRPTNTALQAIQRVNGTWQAPSTIEEPLAMGIEAGQHVAARVNAAGEPVVAYVSYNPSGTLPAYRISLARRTGTSWTRDLMATDTQAIVVIGLDMALDAAGEPHVVYLSRDGVSDTLLRYVYPTDSGYQVQGIPSPINAAETAPLALSFLADGTAMVVVGEAATPESFLVLIKRPGETRWVKLVVDNNQANGQLGGRWQFRTAGQQVMLVGTSQRLAQRGLALLSLQDYRTAISRFEEKLETSELAMSLYPNPTNGPLTLQPKAELTGSWFIGLYNLQGTARWVQEGTQAASFPQRIDLSGQAPGMYLLRIRVQDSWLTARVVRVP